MAYVTLTEIGYSVQALYTKDFKIIGVFCLFIKIL